MRRPLHGEHVETQRVYTPLRLTLPKVVRGADDFTLLTPSDRAESAAEIGTGSLAYFDYGQHAVVEPDQVDFARSAAQVARENQHAVRL